MKRLDCYVLNICVKAVSEAFQQVSTKLSSVGTCACWLEVLSVLPIVVASPAVLESSCCCVLFTMDSCVRLWLNKLNASGMPTMVLVAGVHGSVAL